MILDDIFLFLKAGGLAPTHAIFSTDYLGHSPRYYDYLRCSGAKPSLRSLLKLALRLQDMAREAVTAIDRATAGDLAKQAIMQAVVRCR